MNCGTDAFIFAGINNQFPQLTLRRQALMKIAVVLTKQNIGERYLQHQPHQGLIVNPNILAKLL